MVGSAQITQQKNFCLSEKESIQHLLTLLILFLFGCEACHKGTAFVFNVYRKDDLKETVVRQSLALPVL